MSSIATPRRGGLRRREAIAGFVFISPWIVGFIVFALGPMIYSLYLSLCQYAIVRDPVFVGLGNYITAFTKDRLFWLALEKTAYYATRRGRAWRDRVTAAGSAPRPGASRHLRAPYVLLHAVADADRGVGADLGLDPASPARRVELPPPADRHQGPGLARVG